MIRRRTTRSSDLHRAKPFSHNRRYAGAPPMCCNDKLNERRMSVRVELTVRHSQLVSVVVRDRNLFKDNFEVFHQREEVGQLVLPVCGCQSVC